MPSPAPMTRPCGCGTWRRGAACASSKATRTPSEAWHESDDGSALSGSDDKTVRLWDVETGRCLRVLEGHTATSSVLRGAPINAMRSPARLDKTVRLWDVETGRCLRVLEGHTAEYLRAWRGAPMAAAPSPATRMAASGYGICRNSSPRREHRKSRTSLAGRRRTGPIHERQSPPRRRERRGQDGAFQATGC